MAKRGATPRLHQPLLNTGASFTPEEIAFFGEETLITILPMVKMPALHLLKGKYGPFSSGLPVEVPLWLAVTLKKLQKCKIKPPDWMEVGALERKLEAEKSEESEYEEMPFHYVEISTMLLSCAQDDVPRVHRVRALLEDLADHRNRKMRDGLHNLDTDAAALRFNNLSHMEINNFRPEFVKTLNTFHHITHGDASVPGPATQLSSYTPSQSQGAESDYVHPSVTSRSPELQESPVPLRTHRRQRQALGLTPDTQVSPPPGGMHDQDDSFSGLPTASASDVPRHTSLSPALFTTGIGGDSQSAVAMHVDHQIATHSSDDGHNPVASAGSDEPFAGPRPADPVDAASGSLSFGDNSLSGMALDSQSGQPDAGQPVNAETSQGSHSSQPPVSPTGRARHSEADPENDGPDEIKRPRRSP